MAGKGPEGADQGSPAGALALAKKGREARPLTEGDRARGRRLRRPRAVAEPVLAQRNRRTVLRRVGRGQRPRPGQVVRGVAVPANRRARVQPRKVYGPAA
jgi:hypothetical protein